MSSKDPNKLKGTITFYAGVDNDLLRQYATDAVIAVKLVKIEVCLFNWEDLLSRTCIK